jgi:hypothetical protein
LKEEEEEGEKKEDSERRKERNRSGDTRERDGYNRLTFGIACLCPLPLWSSSLPVPFELPKEAEL